MISKAAFQALLANSLYGKMATPKVNRWFKQQILHKEGDTFDSAVMHSFRVSSSHKVKIDMIRSAEAIMPNEFILHSLKFKNLKILMTPVDLYSFGQWIDFSNFPVLEANDPITIEWSVGSAYQGKGSLVLDIGGIALEEKPSSRKQKPFDEREPHVCIYYGCYRKGYSVHGGTYTPCWIHSNANKNQLRITAAKAQQNREYKRWPK